jgi:hypothetical protein
MACSKSAIKKIQLAQHCILHPLRGCGLRAGVAPDTRRALCEPVSVSSRTGLRPAEMEIEKWRQRPAPETRPARTEIPAIAGQRLGHLSLTRGNDGDSPPPGNNTPDAPNLFLESRRFEPSLPRAQGADRRADQARKSHQRIAVLPGRVRVRAAASRSSATARLRTGDGRLLPKHLKAP